MVCTGVPPQHQQSVFDEFWQIDNTDKRGFGGSGIGLAMSRLLVQAMGGQIAVASDGVIGSTFTFTVQLGMVSRPLLPAKDALAGTTTLLLAPPTAARGVTPLLAHLGATLVTVATEGAVVPAFRAAVAALNASAHASGALSGCEDDDGDTEAEPDTSGTDTAPIAVGPLSRAELAQALTTPDAAGGVGSGSGSGLTMMRKPVALVDATCLTKELVAAVEASKLRLVVLADRATWADRVEAVAARVDYVGKPPSVRELALSLLAHSKRKRSALSHRIDVEGTYTPAATSAMAVPVAPAATSAHIASSLSQCPVLIAEDEPTNLRLMTKMLASVGYVVEGAMNGEEAAAKAGSKQYSLILMDIMVSRCWGR